MSTKPHNMKHGGDQTPRHADVSYEPRDVKVGSIYFYLVTLGATTILALIVCVFILRYTTRFVASSDVPPPQSREALGTTYRPLPPEPRLQGVPGHIADPQSDLRNKVKTDSEANEQLGWIDKQAGIAQIPIEDAMKIIAGKGSLPAAVQPEEKKK